MGNIPSIKDKVLTLYGVLYFSFVIYETIFYSVDFQVSMIVKIIFNLLLATMFYGYVSKKAFFDASTWRSIFYFLVVLYCIYFSLALATKDISLFGVLFITILSVSPLLYMLYLYSNKTQEYWN